ncbi:MAG: VWA domain-containing protein [Deltaproteobacteria bacterium]|nr:VWA domain-containing protein [Deltaproteobacteria bacterium]
MNILVFTQPALLWGLTAASLPLIIHLINRHRARRQPFAAIDFLLKVQRRSARRILLRHILLLASRTMLIMAIVIAAAGPFLRPQAALTTVDPTTTILIIDQSLSMRARLEDSTVFKAAIERARDFVHSLAPGDKACLLAAGLSNEVLVQPCTDSHRTLLDAIDTIKPQWGSSDLIAAFKRAMTARPAEEKTKGSSARILLLTDAAAHAFGSSSGLSIGRSPPEIVLENLSNEAGRDNLAVSRVEQRSQARYLEVSARLTSFSTQTKNNLLTEVRLDQKLLSRGFVDLPAGGSVKKVFNIQWPSQTDVLRVVTPKHDSLEEDNQRLFHVSGRRLVSALLINGDMRPVLHQDELFYLEHALAPAGISASGINFTTITPDRFNEDALDNAEVVFLANVHDLAPEAVSALRSFVSVGGGLFISMGNRIDVDRTNRFLDDLLPWQLRDVIASGPADPDGVHRQGIGFAEVDSQHPVFSLFEEKQLEALKSVRTTKAVVLEPGQAGRQSRILLEYANGTPALVESTHGNGRILLFTSSLDRDWTSWPARASFLPFLQRATSYLAGRLGQLSPVEVVVGASVRIPLASEADGLQVTKPDGTKQRLEANDHYSSEQGLTNTVSFSDTRVPGWYGIEQTNNGKKLPIKTIPGIIVHPPALESNLAPITQEELQAKVGRHARLTLAGLHDAANKPQTLLFLLLGLCLVLVEAVLIRK